MDTPPSSNVLADRRWLIGIGISLAFGIFGAVMALLSYVDRQRPPAAPTTSTPNSEPKGRGKGRGRD